jgi:hypothetical protein
MSKQIEYRIEEVLLEGPAPRHQELLTKLNVLGKSGWQVCSLNMAHHPNFAEGPVAVMMSRES